MKSFRDNLRIAGVLAALSGCSAGFASTLPRETLAGQWVDIEKTTPGDTMVWVLEPNGRDDLLRVTIEAAPHGIRRTEHREHYGRWTVGRLSGDSTAPALCFNRRPGRQAPSCSAFTLDTLPDGSGSQRRLRLVAYQGRHHQSDRVLIARLP